MRGISSFAGGVGAGALLASIVAAVTFLWKPDIVGGWIDQQPIERQRRIRRNLERAERLAQNSADYLDICRAAGL